MNIKDTRNEYQIAQRAEDKVNKQYLEDLRHAYVIAIAANERKTGVRSPALLRVLRALDKEASMARHMMKRHKETN